MMRYLSILISFWLFFLGIASAQTASEIVQTNNAKSQILSEKIGIMPGETIKLAFSQELKDGWHVYWSNPGDSGLPLEMDWSLPQGLSVSEPIYPTPHRLPFNTLINYGYEGRPTFLFNLTADQFLEAGQQLEISVKAVWLICEKICVPEGGTFSLSIPVVAEPAAKDPRGALVVAKAKRHLPKDSDIRARLFDLDGHPVVEVEASEWQALEDVHYFPFTPNQVIPGAREIKLVSENKIYISLAAGDEYQWNTIEALDGVLTKGHGERIEGVNIKAPKISLQDVPITSQTQTLLSSEIKKRDRELDQKNTSHDGPATGQNEDYTIWSILLLVFFGGLLLNIMPCVFPVIFMKAASIAKLAHQEASAIRMHGLFYTLGVLVTFLILAMLLIVLRAGGQELGWGYHLQSPISISLFAIVIFLVGLNLAGVFEIGTSIQGIGNSLTEKSGKLGAFFTGLLAVAVAAPCIGPLLGVPIGFALLQPAPIALLVFGVMGLGLAFPYLLLTLIPALGRYLPKPGGWMEIFKQLLSFAMFATLIWLIWTVTIQSGPDGVVLLLSALLLVSFAAWIFGRGQRQGGRGRATRVMAAVAILGAVLVISDIKPVADANRISGSITTKAGLTLEAVPFSPASLQEYLDEGRPVFIDFTAAWCVTCQFNKQNVIKKEAVIRAFNEKDVVYMVADWTLQDAEITKALQAQGRAGVPLYLVYGTNGAAPEVLPQILSVKIIKDAFAKL